MPLKLVSPSHGGLVVGVVNVSPVPDAVYVKAKGTEAAHAVVTDMPLKVLTQLW